MLKTNSIDLNLAHSSLIITQLAYLFTSFACICPVPWRGSQNKIKLKLPINISLILSKFLFWNTCFPRIIETHSADYKVLLCVDISAGAGPREHIFFLHLYGHMLSNCEHYYAVQNKHTNRNYKREMINDIEDHHFLILFMVSLNAIDTHLTFSRYTYFCLVECSRAAVSVS